MSGETENQVSGWTVDTLHSHLISLLNEIDTRYEQRFAAQEKAVDSALASAEKAVSKAELASEKRFEGVNEFRAALQDSAARNLTRSEYDVAHAALVEQLGELKSRFERYEARGSGTTAGQETSRAAARTLITTIIASAGVIIAAVGVAAALTR